ncbi:tripartite motif-containing protein 14 isoform X1 [Tachysurus fulvidraco]|uniref:tripartite motif-containing protein 14 isoform X1 n=1 Tax=Tachysurus fulvidraco TaxID=1234273 RepID=UPI000F4D4393|nr:tripartite motif-containing protein 14 isoform X1 [Tachysurus fulvidraco]
MGSSLDKPSDSQPVCPLCHCECWDLITLECGHGFCRKCVKELWSGASTGPYYCLECDHEIRKLPDFGQTDRASTSAGTRTIRGLGKRITEQYSPKSFLGKRKFNSSSFRQNSGGYRLGTGSSENHTVIINDSNDTPAKKKATTETSSERQIASPVLGTSSTKTTPQVSVASTSKSCQEDGQSDRKFSKASCSGIQEPPPTPANAASKESPQKYGRSSNSNGEQTGCQNKKAPESSSSSNESSERPLTDCAIICHYCSGREQRSAVKTCLVCGASMCSEHLRVHLESPVFQNHPLVPAVDDVSHWRCQEHQEMNRIYCRPCGVCVCTVCTVIGSHKDHACISIKEAEKELRATLKIEMKKIQTKKAAILNQVQKLTEKKCSVQKSLVGVCAAVAQQYQAMREALDIEEQQALHCVSQEEDRVLKSIQAQLDMLSPALTSLQQTFHPLSNLADSQGASRVQDQAFIMEYKKITESLNGLSDPVEHLESVEEVNQGRLDCLQDWTERRLDIVVISMPHRDPFRLLYGFIPTLDRNTAHPKLLLSAEDRCVEYSEAQQDYPDLETRFNIFPQVLGTTALTQGRHYWEVEVSIDEGRWKVGVCDEHIGRKGQKDASRLGFYPNSWCLVYEKGKVEALHDKATSPVCATGLKKVGVLLDFEEGSLSFFSVGEAGALTLLYCFQHEFSEPLFPALAVSKTNLTICNLYARSPTD